CLVATPHFHRGLFPTPQFGNVHAALMELQALCQKALIYDFKVHLGADCHLHAEIVEHLREGRIPTINNGRYLLLELPDGTLPHRLQELIFDICMVGTAPIITHPERNSVLARHPEILYDLLQSGAYAQVTAASLTGLFGSSVRRAAEQMVGGGLVQMIASDAHDPDHRPPVLSEGRDAATAIVGADLARKMVEDVPRAVIENRHIRFPEPAHPKPLRSSLWRRIWGS
ncbi:MAG: tyrosine-protein phosphatase, partial [Acidobacteriota bacterium]